MQPIKQWNERMPSIAKKRLLRQNYKKHKHLLSSFQRSKSTQSRGSVFADRIEQVKKTKFELKLIKIEVFYLGAHGKYKSDLVTFEVKSL